LGEVLTHDIFKQSQEELHGNLHEDKKKIIAFNAKASNDGNDDDSETSTDDDVALMMKKFKKFMKKKGYQGGSSKSGKSYSKNPFTKKKCFECGEMGHISTNCKKDEDHSNNMKFEGKKKLFKKYNKKKNGKACYVEWDSYASSDSDSDDDEGDEKSSKKSLTGISIKEAPSLFNTPYCLMVKGEPEVNYKFGGRHWVIDSGCTQHMTKNGRVFTSIDNDGSECDNITFGDNSKGKVKGLGKIAISNNLSISNVLLVESLSYNLLSVAQLCDLGLICKFSPKDVVITSIKSDELIFKGFRYGNLYLVDFSSNDASLNTCLFTKSSKGWLWHRRLSHVGMNQLKKLMKHGLVIGLNNDIIFEKNKLCSVCQASKQVGNTHPTKSVMSTSRPLELLHMDLFGPTTYRSIGGNSYGLVVDDYSIYT
jgi:hypothetical protein